jgi:hypothetical protein
LSGTEDLEGGLVYVYGGNGAIVLQKTAESNRVELRLATPGLYFAVNQQS